MLATEASIEFEGIIDIAGRQLDLDGIEVNRLKNAMIKLLSTGPQANRMEAWTNMTMLAMRYADRRRVLFSSRVVEIQKELNRLHGAAHS